MTEIWLRTNTRALIFGMVIPAMLLLIGLIWVALAHRSGGFAWPAWALSTISLTLLLLLAAQCRLPRLAYAEEHLLVYLRAGKPVRVPLDIVEAFFLGRGPSLLPPGPHRDTQTSNLIIRLADKAGDWRQVDVKPALGSWCDGYITIRGMWCEPLNVEVANRLNQRLAEVKQQALVAEATN